MPLTLYTTSTRQSYRNILLTPELTNLKENEPRPQFQNLKYLIPIDITNNLINHQPRIICTQLSAKSIQKNNS